MIERYFYSIWTLIFFFIWFALYIHRKDLRKEMLFVSFIFGIAGIASQYIYLKDWWKPMTLTGTAIGIEDFLIGMFIGGIAAVIYEEIYKKKIRFRSSKKSHLIFYCILNSLAICFLFFGSFYLLRLNSFYSSLITFLVPTFFIWFKRKDLIKPSLISGILMLIIGTLVYFVLFLVLPDYFHIFWYLKETWFASLFLGIPLGEYIWFFLAGMAISPLYEFWQEARLIKIRTTDR